jgi:hypothetical protein
LLSVSCGLFMYVQQFASRMSSAVPSVSSCPYFSDTSNRPDFVLSVQS